jgi:hypothetical protein
MLSNPFELVSIFSPIQSFFLFVHLIILFPLNLYAILKIFEPEQWLYSLQLFYFLPEAYTLRRSFFDEKSCQMFNYPSAYQNSKG